MHWVVKTITIFTYLTVMCLPVRAQVVNAPKRSVTIAPTSFEYKIEPGSSRQGHLTVQNDGQEYLQLHMYSQTFKVRGEDYGDYEFVGADPTDAGGWVGFSPNEFNIAPGQKMDVEFSILPPPQAAPGGHYAVLFAEAEASQSSAVGVGQRAGALVYMQVGGELQKFGEIASFKSKFWQPSTPLSAQLRLHNAGNTHWRANGEVTFKNLFGLSIYRERVNGLVLPQTTRRFELKNKPGVLIPGLYLVSGKVTIFDETVKLAPRLILVLPPLYIGIFSLLVGASVIWLIERKRRRHLQPRPSRVRH